METKAAQLHGSAPRQMLVDPINGGPFDYHMTATRRFE